MPESPQTMLVRSVPVSAYCSRLTCVKRQGAVFFLWQLLHLQMSDTSHGLLLDLAECGLDFTCELLSPP